MRTFSRLGLFSAVGFVGLAAYRVLTRRSRSAGVHRSLPFMRLLPEDGFGGPGVFERAVTFPAVETTSPSASVERVAVPQPASRKPAAKKSAAKKSPAKKASTKKSPAKKSPAKKSPAKKSPAKKASKSS